MQNPVATTPFAVTVESRSNATIVRLAGSCTMMDSQRLSDELLQVASRPHPFIILDLAALDFITSNGLGSIVAGYLRCRKQKGELRLAAPSSAIHDLLHLTRLTALFKVFPTLEAAQAAVTDGA